MHRLAHCAGRLTATGLAITALAVSFAGTSAQEAPEAEAQPATLLAKLAVCRDVQERAPVGESQSFPADVGQLCCFTRVVTEESPLDLYHRWYVGEKLVDEIKISVKGASWRCWSRKTILASWNGPCRVEILTEEGDVIGVGEFALTATESGPTSEKSGG